MMDGALGRLTHDDLLYVARVLTPHADRSRMLYALRNDEDILRAMLADERLFDRLTGEPEPLLQVSPTLLFFILMNRVRRDLQRSRYTIEPNQVAVFDVRRILALLDDHRVSDYLVEVLSSFVHVHSVSVTLRLRAGVWARYRVSDLDLVGMVRFTRSLEEERRFEWYRRIGDLCLFLSGVCPNALASMRGASAARLTRNVCVDSGRSYYAAAARHPSADAAIARLLDELAEGFELAVKPLDHLASHYLGGLRDQMISEG